MRVTVELPDKLVAEALKVSSAKTKTAVIMLGLQELVREHRIADLSALRGKIDLSIDIRKSRGR